MYKNVRLTRSYAADERTRIQVAVQRGNEWLCVETFIGKDDETEQNATELADALENDADERQRYIDMLLD